MRILITGAAGMIGTKLTRRLVLDGHLGGTPISSLILQDIVPPPAPSTAIPVVCLASDLAAEGEAAAPARPARMRTGLRSRLTASASVDRKSVV